MRLLFGLVIACSLLTAGPTRAAQYDCGQPESNGEDPITSDALAILRAAVGQPIANCSGVYFCVCDTNNDGEITTGDALRELRYVVTGIVPVGMDCGPNCPDSSLPACSSATFSIRESDFSYGWTGIAHDEELVRGEAFSVSVKRTCSATSSTECLRDDDCPGSETCEPTCNCNDDTSCDLTGPTQPTRCLRGLELCSVNADCASGPCVQVFGPPTPLSSGGTPVCLTTVFESPVSGTFDSATGETQISTNLRMWMSLGIAIDKPCPRCGAPDQNPQIGDQFTCDGSDNSGQACTVDGVSEEFGGTSYDCPPHVNFALDPPGLAIRLGEQTTGTSTKTAQLPCKFFGFGGNPTVPGSNPKCTDKTGTGDPVCTSNADCMRCTGDSRTVCTVNADCTGNGVCAEAPDQPVTCGFWCHCGFCDGNASLPCFETSECPDGQLCEMGTAAANQPGMPQQRPNDCSGDQFICGGDADEQCATTSVASCSDQPYRICESDEDCETFDAGSCSFAPRSCFESRIARSGDPSPLGRYCAFEDRACDSNADCTGSGDLCVADAARPDTVALVCMPATTNGAVNSTSGITGPAALGISYLVEVCRCGDGTIGCEEECDDGNDDNGDGCDEVCEDDSP